jgi:hypothetical protein
MRVIETKVYTFDELSEETKEKVIEKNRYVNVDISEWYYFVYDVFKHQYSNLFEITNIYFSGFYSQGDGAMFEYGGITDKLIDEFISQLQLSTLRKKIVKEAIHFSGSGTHKGNYNHERSCSHSIYVESQYDLETYHNNIQEFIYNIQIDFEYFIEEKYIELCGELYQSLNDEYEWYTSDKAIKEHFIENEYEFTEKGELI